MRKRAERCNIKKFVSQLTKALFVAAKRAFFALVLNFFRATTTTAIVLRYNFTLTKYLLVFLQVEQLLHTRAQEHGSIFHIE